MYYGPSIYHASVINRKRLHPALHVCGQLRAARAAVQFGGGIMTDRTFSMSERVLDALIAAVTATAAPEKKRA